METRRDSDLEFPELEDIHLKTHSRTFVAIIVLFAAIVFAGLFFLCQRWICRSSRRPLPRSRRATPRRPRGLDRATIDGLPVSVVGNGGDVEAGECSICLGVLEDGDKVKVLPECRHYYHCECVDRWLRSESTCPVCRASLRVDSEPPKIITQ